VQGQSHPSPSQESPQVHLSPHASLLHASTASVELMDDVLEQQAFSLQASSHFVTSPSHMSHVQFSMLHAVSLDDILQQSDVADFALYAYILPTIATKATTIPKMILLFILIFYYLIILPVCFIQKRTKKLFVERCFH
jgi:hypothetical protein